MSATSAVLIPEGITPTGETVIREIPGVGLLKFENYAAGEWMTRAGRPAKTARRRYSLDDTELDSVSSITGTLDKPALLGWYEDQASRGAVAAERMGELAGVAQEDYAKRIRALGLGPSAARDEGADRGKAIHMALHMLVTEGRPPNPADFPDTWRPWMQGAMRAWLALDPTPTSSEEIVCYPELGYAGRPDLLATVAGVLTLVDYKTGKGRVYDAAHYQTRLYAMALLRSLQVEVERIVIVGIDDDGGFQLVECEATEDDALALLHAYRSRKRINAGMATQRQLAGVASKPPPTISKHLEPAPLEPLASPEQRASIDAAAIAAELTPAELANIILRATGADRRMWHEPGAAEQWIAGALTCLAAEHVGAVCDGIAGASITGVAGGRHA